MSNFIIFLLANPLKILSFRITSFQYSDPPFLNFAISNFLIFQFSNVISPIFGEKKLFQKKKKILILHPHLQFSLNFHLTFHYSSRSPIKRVGKSNDKTIRKHRRIQFNNDSHAFQNYRFIGHKSLAGSVFPSHPVCTRLSVKLLIGVHASRREGEGEGRGGKRQR